MRGNNFRFLTCMLSICVLLNLCLPATVIYGAEVTDATVKSLLSAYKEQLSAFEGETINGFTSDTEYYVYDIDKDSIPELIIKHGTCEADYYYSVHTFNGETAQNAGTIMGGHAALASCQSNGIFCHVAQMGYEFIFGYTLANHQLSKAELYSGEGTYKYDRNIAAFQEGSEWLKSSQLSDYTLLENYVEQNVATLIMPDVTVTVNGEAIEFDQPPVIKDDRTFVPIRKVAEKLGATVLWDDSSHSVTISSDNGKIELRIGYAVPSVNGIPIVIDAAPYIENGRTLVPVRFVAQALGANVVWDGEKRDVKIESNNTDESIYSEYVNHPELPVIYTLDESSGDREVLIPQLNLKNEDTVSLFNERILNKVNPHREYLKEWGAISYTYSIHNDIASVVVYYDNYNADWDYYTFNFNIKTGQEVSLSDLCKMLQLDENSYIGKVQEKCVSAFEVMNPVLNISNMGISQDFYDTQRNKAGQCFSASSKWFISRGNTICVIVTLPGITGGDYSYAIDTGISLV